MYKKILKDLKETDEFGIKLGEKLIKGDIICLDGDLGAGKTTLTQSIAKGLMVEDYVTSPTFAIINEYEGVLPLYHFDVYRLESAEEGFDLGFEEYFYGDGICIIEWAKKIEEILPKDCLKINLKLGDNQERILEFKAKGERYEKLIKELE